MLTQRQINAAANSLRLASLNKRGLSAAVTLVADAFNLSTAEVRKIAERFEWAYA